MEPQQEPNDFKQVCESLLKALENYERSAERFEREERLAQSKRTGWLSNFLIAGGLVAAAGGFGAKVAEDYWFGDEAEICAEAYETVRDDTLNGDIAPEKRRKFLDSQIDIAIYCANRNLR